MKEAPLRTRLFSLPPLWRLVKAIGWRSVSKAEMQRVLSELSKEYGEEAMEAAAQELLRCEGEQLDRWTLVPTVTKLAGFIIGHRPYSTWEEVQAPSAPADDAGLVQGPAGRANAAEETSVPQALAPAAKPVREARTHVLLSYREHLKHHRIPFVAVKEVTTEPKLRLRVVDLLVYRGQQNFLVAVRPKLTKLLRHDLLEWKKVESFREFVAMRVWAVRSKEGSSWTEEVVRETDDVLT